MITRRSFTLAAVAGAAAAAIPGIPGAAAASRPVVVELFTSQGCSSCPPADAYLGRLAAREDVIALAYHVDYWDYIGWADPFADATYTTRQRAYRDALGNRTLYTPQMIVDGEADAVGSDSRAVDALIREHLEAAGDARPVVRVEASLSRGELHAQIHDTGMPGPADVLAVAYDTHHRTEIRRGENGGVTLDNFNVVRAIRKIGEFHGPGRTLSVPAKPWTQVEGGIAILVQGAEHGPIWGATKVLVA
ncbi:DUF1223 domain-containing protein [Thalassobaculum sp. OXR-137]|uniref:DUF1223 domain-containing protein n=1 Tax=Thalassobaculum sp. OXR-137 TaxID=3100173 RepID=UPI002AC95ABF|nr:DUF1223 domain-containing protein [Thalassobaculum sp. OXR-137]WPZ36002.1 DUF1223 domain-containing protein [Thalassobaculum sp. OXR-137]